MSTNRSSSSSSNKHVIFEKVTRNEESYNEWKYKLDEFVIPICNGVTTQAIKMEFGITEIIAYISDNRLEKLKAFAFISTIKSGMTFDRKNKSVNFLILQIICSAKQRKGYGSILLNEIESKAIRDKYEYLIISSPNKDSIPFYIKYGYQYLEKGTIDGIIQFDCCWKKIN